MFIACMNRVDKESVSSRAYIAFKSAEQVSQFSREYDGHLFRDKQGDSSSSMSFVFGALQFTFTAKGNESFAVVEFAPFQKLPPERKKADARAGTILQGTLPLYFTLHVGQCWNIRC